MITAENVSVKYTNKSTRKDLKTVVFDAFHRRGLRKEEFWALKSINFQVGEGEILGIIGANGAGKSTLCRVIANILSPDTGSMKVHGLVSALLSLGTGFNSRLTGKENIYLNGMMLGFSKKKISQLYNDIVEFSGIGDFIDQPIKQYSKGMRSRLGFSIAAMLEPDILVLDETLSVGDEEFKKKASRKMFEIINHAKMVIIVSHDLDFIQQRCTQAIWIDKGKIREAGDPKQICSRYKESVPPRKKRKKYLANFSKTTAEIADKDVVKVENLSIKFKVKDKDFWALKQVSFSVKKGEIVGIIGHNGAGKSTLCKAMSGILKPDEGSVLVKGRTTELLGFGAGFNNQLSGADNIFLNGLLLGIPKKRIKQIFNDIVDFSELQSSIDKPIKQYSSGMRSRLGFSIATATDPDILIIDEALSTGDHAFYEKAAERIQETILSSKAVVVVTHNMKFVLNICTKAILIDNGRIIFVGETKKAIKAYKGLNLRET